MNITIQLNPKDVEGVKSLLRQLDPDLVEKAHVRCINTTMTGVRTDGVGLLSDHYALTASAIRESFDIRKAKFRDPSGVVSSQGTFIRLKEFGAKATKTGVSVKVLKKNPRAVIAHAFFARLQKTEQVYWRAYRGPRKPPVPGRAYARMPFSYRFPVKALYGPRIQDYLSDPQVIDTLTRMAGDRISKNMEREVNAILRGY